MIHLATELLVMRFLKHLYLYTTNESHTIAWVMMSPTLSADLSVNNSRESGAHDIVTSCYKPPLAERTVTGYSDAKGKPQDNRKLIQPAQGMRIRVQQLVREEYI